MMTTTDEREEMQPCRMCERKPQILVLENSVKLACPTGCKIVEAANLADALYVWGEKWLHKP